MHKLLAFLLISIHILLYGTDHTADSIRNLIATSDSIEKIELQGDLALYLENIAVDNINEGKYSIAMGNILEALELNKALGNRLSEAYNFNVMGIVFDKNQSYEKSKEYYSKALDLFVELHDSVGIGMASVNISNLYYAGKEYEKAISWYKKSLDLNGVQSNQKGKAICLSNIGHAYRELGEFDSAYLYFKKVLDNLDLNETPDLFVYTMNSIAQNELDTKLYEKASVNAYQSIEFAKKFRMIENLKEAYRIYSEANAALGNYEIAYKNNKLFQAIKDSLFSESKNKQLSEIEASFSSRQKTLEINELKAKQLLKEKEAEEQTIMLISIGVVLLLFLILILNFYRIKSYSLRQESMYLKEKETLSKLEIESQQMELDHKKRELSSSTLHVVNKNEFLSEVKQMVTNQLKNAENREVISALNQISRYIDDNIKMDEGWDTFKKHFDSVHPNFFNILENKHNSLTTSEVKLCAYILMNLETKEMAQILNISPDSVSKKKTRLKAKLGLSSSNQIPEYLKSFA